MPFDAGDDALLRSGRLAGEPEAGMEFALPEAARAFYCAYAARAGFRVRSSKSFTSRVDDAVIMRRFVCTRQGLPSRKDPLDASEKRRNRPSARPGCPSMLQVNRCPGAAVATVRWVVSCCVLEHSHPLGGDHADGAHDTEAPGERSGNSWQLLSGQNGDGNAELFQPGGLRLGPFGSVTHRLLEHFKKMQVENPAFCYAVQLDQSGCLANPMWV